MAMQAFGSTCEPPPVEQGLELLEVFMEIADPHLRQDLVDLAKLFRAKTSAVGSRST